MIDFTKVTSVAPAIQYSLEKSSKAAGAANPKVLNLNNIPHYKILPPLETAKKALSHFQDEYGEVKSATLVSQLCKNYSAQGTDKTLIADLSNQRFEYSKHIKTMRKYMWAQKFNSYEEYCEALKRYIKTHGTYLNCNEVADLVLSDLSKKGVRADNVFVYSINEKGERCNLLEHVFCVVGLDKDTKINDISSWPKSAAICDPWAGIAMSAEDGIEFFKKFFGLNPERHTLGFQRCFKGYPGI